MIGALDPSGHGALRGIRTARPWTDDRAWITDIVRAANTDEKLATLFSWVLAAGGWIDGMTAELPPLPPRNQRPMAALELRRMLRQSGIAILDHAEPSP